MRAQLSLMFFMQFAVWGSYQTSLGTWLSAAGLGSTIGYFYAMQGLASIFMPTLMGLLADRRVPCQRLLVLCHALCAVAMLAMAYYAANADRVQFTPLFLLYSVGVLFYMPTLGLSLSVAYNAFAVLGMDAVKSLPPVRIWGTIGFIAAMLTVDATGLQTGPAQMDLSALLGFLLSAYALFLPHCPTHPGDNEDNILVALWHTLRDAFGVMREPRMAMFFIFSMLLGVALQVTNGYAGPYLQAFGGLDVYAEAFTAQHPNALISLSQLSETFCILLIPFAMRRFGIKGVMLTSMTAWVLRFGLLGVGAPVLPDVAAWVLSMVVYGVAFDFFNISGSLFVEGEVSPAMRASAQGLFLLMTNGLGAGIGTLAAGAVVNHFVYAVPDAAAQVEGWRSAWLIFAAYAACVAIAFALLFRNRDDRG